MRGSGKQSIYGDGPRRSNQPPVALSSAANAALRALRDPPPVRGAMTTSYRTSATPYEHSQDSRCSVFDEQKVFMKHMYTGQEGSPTDPNAAYAASTATNDSVPTIAPITNTRAGTIVEETYIHFDTFNQGANRLTISGRDLQFPFAAISNIPTIDNVVRISIEPFYFPTLNGPPDKPDYFFNRRIFVYITSLSGSQYVYTASTSPYHFEFDIEYMNTVTSYLKPLNPDYIFQRRIDSITDFNLQFFVSAPMRPLKFPYDVVAVSVVNGSNPGQFRIVSDQSTEFLIPSYVIPNTISYPYDLTQPDRTKCAVRFLQDGTVTPIPDVNQGLIVFSEIGHFVTRLVAEDVVEVDGLDFSGGAFTGTYTMRMHIPKNTITFRARFTSARQSSQAILPSTYE